MLTLVSALTGILLNLNGHESSKRGLHSNYAQSIEKYSDMLIKAHRKITFRTIMGYRTDSLEAIYVITPMGLLLEEREHDTSEKGRRQAREGTMKKWQKRWTTNIIKGHWTKMLISRKEQWMNSISTGT